MSKEDATKLENLVEADKAGLRVEPYPGCEGVYRLVPKKKSLRIIGGAEIEKREKRAKSRVPSPPPVDCKKLVNKKEEATAEKIGVFKPACIGTSAASKCATILYFRSPEAMLYYLGEVVRAELKPDFAKPRSVFIQHCLGFDAPLFEGKKSVFDKDVLAAVDYDGSRYVIPNEENVPVCKEADVQ